MLRFLLCCAVWLIGCGQGTGDPTDPGPDGNSLAGSYYLVSVDGRLVPDSVLACEPSCASQSWHRVYLDTLVVMPTGTYRWHVTHASALEVSETHTTINGTLAAGGGSFPSIFATDHPVVPASVQVGVAQPFADSIRWVALPPWPSRRFVTFAFRRAY